MRSQVRLLTPLNVARTPLNENQPPAMPLTQATDAEKSRPIIIGVKLPHSCWVDGTSTAQCPGGGDSLQLNGEDKP